MELVEKAWVINPLNLSDESKFHLNDDPVYAKTNGKAKSLLLERVYLEDIKHWSGDDITFLSLRVKREKFADRYLVNGEIKPFWWIENTRKTDERDNEMDKLVRENPNAMAHIMKGAYYYRDNNNGYTEHKIAAGVYTIQNAANSVKGTSLGDCMMVIVLDKEEHNAYLNKHIEAIKNRLIT